MTRRLVALLGWAAVLLLLPAPPAAASCVGIGQVLEDEPAVAFVGDVQRQITDGGALIARFRVGTVHRGEVHRTQDVLVPADEVTSAGVSWSEGDTVLVLGRLEDGRILTNGCMSVEQGYQEYDASVAALGAADEPLPGVDRIEPEGLNRRDLLWIRLVVGVIGFAALGVLAVRWARSRRTG